MRYHGVQQRREMAGASPGASSDGALSLNFKDVMFPSLSSVE